LSTEPTRQARTAARTAGITVLLATAAASGNAAEVDFRPSLSFGVFHDGNISVTGGAHGDEAALLTVDLTVERKMPTSSLLFTYRPSYVAYNKSSDLDYFGNTIDFSFSHDGARASHFFVDVYLVRTDYQGPTAATADLATTYVPRTTLTQGIVKVAQSVAAGKRGFFDWQVRASADRRKDLADNPATATPGDPVDFNDADAVGARLGWRSELSTRNTLGAGLDVARFGYEFGPSVTVETLGLVGTCQASEFWLIEYAVGGSRADQESDSISGFSFNTTVTYATDRASTFSAGARQVFAPGVGVGAATQDRGVWASYSHTPAARGLSGSAIVGYWQRDELEFASSGPGNASDSITVNGTLGWNFNPYLALSAYGAYIDQNARKVTDPVIAASLNTNYSSYGLYLRWAIRGR
jgi:hypothetical protein